MLKTNGSGLKKLEASDKLCDMRILQAQKIFRSPYGEAATDGYGEGENCMEKSLCADYEDWKWL